MYSDAIGYRSITLRNKRRLYTVGLCPYYFCELIAAD